MDHILTVWHMRVVFQSARGNDKRGRAKIQFPVGGGFGGGFPSSTMLFTVTAAKAASRMIRGQSRLIRPRYTACIPAYPDNIEPQGRQRVQLPMPETDLNRYCKKLEINQGIIFRTQ